MLWCEPVFPDGGRLCLFDRQAVRTVPVAAYDGCQWAGPLPEPTDPAGGFPPPAGQ